MLKRFGERWSLDVLHLLLCSLTGMGYCLGSELLNREDFYPQEACGSNSGISSLETEKQLDSQLDITHGCNCVLRHRQGAEEHNFSKETK